MLALAFWLSVAGFVVLLTRHEHSQATRWSTWKPKAQGLTRRPPDRARGRRRRTRRPNGTQLVAVQEHAPYVPGRCARGGRRAAARPERVRSTPYIGLFGTDRTLIYAFCGLQTNCSLAGTTTSVKERILRREALELSLYAFKYLKNVDQVVSLVQTVKDGGTSAVFLRKRDLQPELDHPASRHAAAAHATRPAGSDNARSRRSSTR